MEASLIMLIKQQLGHPGGLVFTAVIFVGLLFFVYWIMHFFKRHASLSLAMFAVWGLATFVLGHIFFACIKYGMIRFGLGEQSFTIAMIMHLCMQVVALILAGIVVRAIPFVRNRLKISARLASLYIFEAGLLYAIFVALILSVLMRYIIMPQLDEMRNDHAEIPEQREVV